jgi:nicotinamidase-related amidase
MAPIDFQLPQTALVVIDLQNSNIARTLAPHAARLVADNSARLALAVRQGGGTVVHVRVLVNELPNLPADKPVGRDPAAPPLPPSASELSGGVSLFDDDVFIVKRQWGAFYGTALEQQLRRRGIDTVIMAGIATNFGVESTARIAFDHGYKVVFAEDAMSSVSAEMHRFATEAIFPVIGRVRTTAQILDMLKR